MTSLALLAAFVPDPLDRVRNEDRLVEERLDLHALGGRRADVGERRLIPIKVVNGQPVLVRDVAYVRDGGPPQVNVVRADGAASVLMRG
jgi:multidrug efflux pump subunit AcrB